MAEEGQRDVFQIYVKFCLRIVQIFNFFGITTKVLSFVVLWCDTKNVC